MQLCSSSLRLPKSAALSIVTDLRRTVYTVKALSPTAEPSMLTNDRRTRQGLIQQHSNELLLLLGLVVSNVEVSQLIHTAQKRQISGT